MRVCVRWQERGSLVCRPQIYDAVTLSEESSVSSAARTRDKRSRFHAVLSFILTSHSAPLIFHFYSNSLVLHHLCSCAFTALCFSQFSSSLETSHTLTNWTKQKVVTSVCWLLRCPTVRVLFILQGRREAVLACTGQWLIETFNFTEQMDKPKQEFQPLNGKPVEYLCLRY